MGQFGVSMPGGAEVLVHARSTIEELGSRGELPPMAVVDVDLINCFGTFEWPKIVEAVDRHLPVASPWNRWSCEHETDVRLPSGELVSSNRGAGQGEPGGPLKASVTIGDAVVKTMATDAGNRCATDGRQMAHR